MLQCLFGRRVINQIAVTAGLGAKARMEFIIHRTNPLQRHTSRQIGIHPHQPAVITASCRGIEMNHLPGSMYARVGAACADDINRVIGDL